MSRDNATIHLFLLVTGSLAFLSTFHVLMLERELPLLRQHHRQIPVHRRQRQSRWQQQLDGVAASARNLMTRRSPRLQKWNAIERLGRGGLQRAVTGFFMRTEGTARSVRAALFEGNRFNLPTHCTNTSRRPRAPRSGISPICRP